MILKAAWHPSGFDWMREIRFDQTFCVNYPICTAYWAISISSTPKNSLINSHLRSWVVFSLNSLPNNGNFRFFIPYGNRTWWIFQLFGFWVRAQYFNFLVHVHFPPITLFRNALLNLYRVARDMPITKISAKVKLIRKIRNLYGS